MVMSLERDIQIEDLRNHPRELVMNLQKLLASGANVTPASKRPGYFEVESGARVYYINISPNTGKILLLATWPIDEETAKTAHAA
jgi:hypothetical protein